MTQFTPPIFSESAPCTCNMMEVVLIGWMLNVYRQLPEFEENLQFIYIYI